MAGASIGNAERSAFVEIEIWLTCRGHWLLAG